MKVLELFAGTRSIGKAFEAKGHEVFSVEWNKDFENIDLSADISKVTADEIIDKFGKPDVIWASPDCSTFSIAAISHHRRKNEETGNLDPVSDYAKFCDYVDQHVLNLIMELQPRFYFIENPMGGMRKMTWMQTLPRYTVTYCQYGDKRMKPTDIWTNHPDPQFKPMCHNGDPCHEKAPRGSRTGTQGLKGSKERSVIPEELCNHIVDICEKYIEEKEIKTMELKIKEISFPEVIEFNFTELKQEITDKVAMYKNLVYTEDQLKEAKKDVAALRKFTNALSDERIKVKNECLKPYEAFEAKINELSSIVNKPIELINKQVQEFEEKKKQEKMDSINEYWNSIESKPDGLALEELFDQKWLNASTSMESIQETITAAIEKFNQDMSTLENLPEYGFEAQQAYISSLDITKALNEAHRLSEVAKKKAEAEALKAQYEQERAKRDAEADAAAAIEKATTYEEVAAAKQWISFQALMTTEDAYALKAFFLSREIEFKAV